VLVALIVAMLVKTAIVVVVLGGGLAAVLYVACGRVLRISEITNLMGTVRGRLGR
jgi:hypothetical protein